MSDHAVASESPLESSAAAAIPLETPSTEVVDRASHHLVLGILSAAVLLVASLLQVHDQSQVRFVGLNRPLPEICTYRRWTGKPCPGCGMTRSFVSMAHGQWTAAWQYHPFGALLFLYCGCQFLYRGVQVVRIRRGYPAWRVGRWHDWMATGYLGAFTLFALYRLAAQWLLTP